MVEQNAQASSLGKKAHERKRLRRAGEGHREWLYGSFINHCYFLLLQVSYRQPIESCLNYCYPLLYDCLENRLSWQNKISLDTPIKHTLIKSSYPFSTPLLSHTLFCCSLLPHPHYAALSCLIPIMLLSPVSSPLCCPTLLLSPDSSPLCCPILISRVSSPLFCPTLHLSPVSSPLRCSLLTHPHYAARFWSLLTHPHYAARFWSLLTHPHYAVLFCNSLLTHTISSSMLNPESPNLCNGIFYGFLILMCSCLSNMNYDKTWHLDKTAFALYNQYYE